MFDRDRWQEIYSALRKNPFRTILTAFGVGWGIFMLILMLAAGNGLQTGVMKEFGGMAINSVFIWTQRTSIPYAGLPKGRRFNMQNEDLPVIKREVPEMQTLAPRLQLRGYRGGNNVSSDKTSGTFSVMGDYPDIADIVGMKITSGRFINHLDLEEKRKVVVIGTNVRDVLFDGMDPINQNVKINGVYFKVVGVWKSDRTGGEGERDTQTLITPFSTFQKAFNYGNMVGWLAIEAKPEYTATMVEEKIKSVLKRRHKVAPEDERALGSFNAQEQFGKMMGLFGAIKGIGWFVGIMTLLAGIIGVTNIMLIIIKERTKEIGIRRAIGATPRSIITQIILESVTLTSLAGYTGLVLGVLITEVISKALAAQGQSNDGTTMFSNPEIDLNVALIALAVLIVSGALAGLIPARKAVSIKPIDALRSE